jgi:hypothetical protein
LTLGKRTKAKHPAHPDNYPDEGPISLVDAWEELSHTEFALWCRLCAEPPEGLYHGRRGLAKRLGYSYRQFNELTRALSRQRYISLHEGDVGNTTAIRIERRGVVGIQTNFLRLAR